MPLPTLLQILRIGIVPAPHKLISSLPREAQYLNAKHSLLKRICTSFTCPAKSIEISVCNCARSDDEKINETINRIQRACKVCTKSGRPSQSRNISLSHVNSPFNQQIQMHFTHCLLVYGKGVIFISSISVPDGPKLNSPQ